MTLLQTTFDLVSMTDVTAVLADAWGVSEQSIRTAMNRDSTVRDRINSVHEDPDSVDVDSLHADVKLVLMGEQPRRTA